MMILSYMKNKILNLEILLLDQKWVGCRISRQNWFSSHFQFMSTAEGFTSISRDCNFFSNNNIFFYQSLSFLKEFLNHFEVSRILCILNFGICNILLITLILLKYNKLAIHNTYKCDIFSSILSIIEFIPLLIPSKNSKKSV